MLIYNFFQFFNFKYVYDNNNNTFNYFDINGLVLIDNNILNYINFEYGSYH